MLSLKLLIPIFFKLCCTGNGKGDLKGIQSKLPVLQALGVDYVWLSPVYVSPWTDSGYDFSDYRNINPAFGSMADWEDLLEATHSTGMKLM